MSPLAHLAQKLWAVRLPENLDPLEATIMNNQLIQIEDDVLDQVSGGAEIVIGPGAIGGVIDGAIGVVKGTVDFLGGAVKGVLSWLPTISVSWGKPRG
jgi:hypothetical protein